MKLSDYKHARADAQPIEVPTTTHTYGQDVRATINEVTQNYINQYWVFDAAGNRIRPMATENEQRVAADYYATLRRETTAAAMRYLADREEA